ncbi:hypothetical protein [Novosphingobium album (ex Hu et al. 2023)]|uniref:Energy transducer TonB n=1 Tax=Novosphingobium album (ex Hu et al. 2023) TaxID=2930093 RepID=A0ABT0B2G1_9SPHN|nr:hypothetical protein [Novosphingobium album (ex Hu et al. 2023)]MCJ2179232.1 hypothetical protein [Novosphingobium album (ex Hu et al. 2023)]
MAGQHPPQITSGLVEPITTPRHYAAPGARELRAQAVHRLQVGLFGLCAMLLLVGLANIIMDRARLTDTEDPIHDVIAVDAVPKKPATDPLADIGVVPAVEPSPTPTPTARPNPMDSAEANPLPQP